MYIISSLSQVPQYITVIIEGLVGQYEASPFFFLYISSNLFTTQRQKDHIIKI